MPSFSAKTKSLRKTAFFMMLNSHGKTKITEMLGKINGYYWL